VTAAKAWAVIRREFVTRVRTRWFVISTISVPALLFGTLVIPLWAGGREGGSVRRIAVLDATRSSLGPALERELARTGRWVVSRISSDEGGRERILVDSLSELAIGGILDGFILVGERAITDGAIEYHGSNAGSVREMRELKAVVQQTVSSVRLREAGVSAVLLAEATAEVKLAAVALARRGGRESSGEGAIVLAYLMAFTLYIALFVYGQSVLRSVIEEKTTRIVEVLASSMRPETLMVGKVIGVGAVGLFQLSIWVLCGIVAYTLRNQLATLLDTPDVASLAIPGVGLGAMAVAVCYFTLGFFLFSTLYAAAGAVVTSEQEAQHAQLPVTLLLVPGILVFPAVLDDPSGGLGTAMSFIPFSSPIIMPARWVVGVVGFGELAWSIGILIATTGIGILMAARIYRIGILMYGKRATVGEIAHWLITSWRT
jgi:ABC-2 type transport system permease protein